MTITTTLFRTLDELRLYVYRMLCEPDRLELHAFPLTQRVLVRNDRPCGMYYCLHGPRAVKFSAIWDAVRNVVDESMQVPWTARKRAAWRGDGPLRWATE